MQEEESQDESSTLLTRICMIGMSASGRGVTFALNDRPRISFNTLSLTH